MTWLAALLRGIWALTMKMRGVPRMITTSLRKGFIVYNIYLISIRLKDVLARIRFIQIL